MAMKSTNIFLTTALVGILLAGTSVLAATNSSKSIESKPKASITTSETKPALPPKVGGPTAPKAVKLRDTNTKETEANAIWNIRAALNIAALQCQFLPFLATVRTYNDILRQHSEELNQARLTLLDHFKRYDGAKYQNSFDQYTTRTYNSFSTIDAQLPFCEMAGVVGREVLSLSKGNFGKAALRLNPVMRASLEPGVGLPQSLIIVDFTPRELPNFAG